MNTEEEVYMAKSLKFINSYKNYFRPVLSNIASKMNEDKELIKAMNTMKEQMKEEDTNSNLKELITLLSASDVYSDEVIEYKTDDGIDHTAYVKQTLELMNIERSKERYYKLLFMVMQDMKEKDNEDLMKLVQNFKQKNNEWKKMVGMLIPKGARVKISNDILIIEGISKYSLAAINNKKTPITSNQLTGTVVRRAKLTGDIYGGEFLKIVSVPKDILRHKKYHKKEFKPEQIELYKSKAETQEKEALEEEPEPAPATGTATAKPTAVPALSLSPATVPALSPAPAAGKAVPATDHNDVELQLQQKGGQQRTTRKHKNSIIGSARKTRTYR